MVVTAQRLRAARPQSLCWASTPLPWQRDPTGSGVRGQGSGPRHSQARVAASQLGGPSLPIGPPNLLWVYSTVPGDVSSCSVSDCTAQHCYKVQTIRLPGPSLPKQSKKTKKKKINATKIYCNNHHHCTREVMRKCQSAQSEIGREGVVCVLAQDCARVTGNSVPWSPRTLSAVPSGSWARACGVSPV